MGIKIGPTVRFYNGSRPTTGLVSMTLLYLTLILILYGVVNTIALDSRSFLALQE